MSKIVLTFFIVVVFISKNKISGK